MFGRREARLLGGGTGEDDRGAGSLPSTASLKSRCPGPNRVPFRLTAAPALTVWSGPAFAVGGWFWEMVIVLPIDQADSAKWLSRAWAFTVYEPAADQL